MRLFDRSRTEWGIRLLVAAVAVIIGYGSVVATLAANWRSPAVAMAYRLAPGDGRIAAAWSEAQSDVQATAATRRRADAVARTALLRDPTAVAAASTIGLNAQLRGDTATARRSFAYAMQLSRRHLQTQLWAIEDAVARNDVAAALDQYDIALRTSRGGAELLFPILAGAIDDPEIRTMLISRLSRGVPWGNDFMISAAATSPAPAAMAQLLTGARRAGVTVPESAQSRTVDALLATGQPEKAWSYYATIRPGVDRRVSRNPTFAEERIAPSQLDWLPVNNDQVAATIEAGADGGRFDFRVSGLAGGPVLGQIQLLPPGTYVLEGRTGATPAPSAGGAYWALSCQNGKELGRASLGADGRFKALLRVPAGCPVQVLTLIAAPSEQAGGITGQIVDVRLSPATST